MLSLKLKFCMMIDEIKAYLNIIIKYFGYDLYVCIIKCYQTMKQYEKIKL
jgi:hypothetical protein